MGFRGVEFLALDTFGTERDAGWFSIHFNRVRLEIWPKQARSWSDSVFPSFSSNSPAVLLGAAKNRTLTADITHICHIVGSIS